MFDDSLLQLLPNHQNQQYNTPKVESLQDAGHLVGKEISLLDSLGDSKMIHNHPQFQWKLFSQDTHTRSTSHVGHVAHRDLWPRFGHMGWSPRFWLTWTTRARGRSFRKKNLTTGKSLPIECLQVRPCVGMIFCDQASDHPPLHDISFDIFVVSFSWHLCLFTSLYSFVWKLCRLICWVILCCLYWRCLAFFVVLSPTLLYKTLVRLLSLKTHFVRNFLKWNLKKWKRSNSARLLWLIPELLISELWIELPIFCLSDDVWEVFSNKLPLISWMISHRFVKGEARNPKIKRLLFLNGHAGIHPSQYTGACTSVCDAVYHIPWRETILTNQNRSKSFWPQFKWSVHGDDQLGVPKN